MGTAIITAFLQYGLPYVVSGGVWLWGHLRHKKLDKATAANTAAIEALQGGKSGS